MFGKKVSKKASTLLSVPFELAFISFKILFSPLTQESNKCSDPRKGTSFFKCYPLQTIFWVFVLLCEICYHHWPNDWHICPESRKVHQVIVTWKWLQRSVCIKSIQRQINKIMWYLIQHRQKTLFKHLHFYNQHLTAVTL